jgi:hypothetical protein
LTPQVQKYSVAVSLQGNSGGRRCAGSIDVRRGESHRRRFLVHHKETENVAMKKSFSYTLVALMVLTMVAFTGLVTAGDETAAQAGEKTGVEGQFVRVAENDEGWVVLGYETANGSLKEKWMLLDIGLTLQNGVEAQKITRDQVKLVTPDDQVISMATQEEYMSGHATLDPMNERANIESQSINYFPVGRTRPCRIGFFGNMDQRVGALSFNEVTVDDRSACLGRIYFQIPDGIVLGNYNFDVQFAGSIVRVPFKIMTKEEAKAFDKEWKTEEKEEKH